MSGNVPSPENGPAPSAIKGLGLKGFVILQLVLVAVAVAAASQRLRAIDARFRLPELRTTPLTVAPRYDYPWIVSDEQLQAVLTNLYPRLRGENPKINHVDHALRFWGPDAEFNDPTCLSGREMRAILTDHRVFARFWKDAEPLLQMTRSGVRVRTQQGLATASHVDHTLAGLAEIGTPTDHPLVLGQRATTVGRLVHSAMRNFKFNQLEYEWSALAFTLYLAPRKEWTTAEGQRITLDRLADRIMRQPYHRGVCLGNHRLHTLVMMLRVDEQMQILEPSTRSRVVLYLQDAVARLMRTQHADGYWDERWSDEPQDPSAPTSKRDPQATRILATGHALEWLALAPQELHPPRENLIRAGQWLARTVAGLDRPTVKKSYTFLTHAGRALALWRGKFPADFLPPVKKKPAAAAPQPASADAAAASAGETPQPATHQPEGFATKPAKDTGAETKPVAAASKN